MPLICHQFPCLEDNFGVLLHDPNTGATASIDVPEAEKVLAALAEKGWKLTHILVTHHHADHIQGIPAVKAATGATVIGPVGERDLIPTLDVTVGGGEEFAFAGHSVQVIDTPAHSIGQIAFHIPTEKLVFTGDALFSLGCGRLFAGDAQMMWASLSRLMALPADTTFYCGHEYTLSNARFALRHDPDNPALQRRAAEVEALRAAGKPTLPSTIGAELAANPFLRAADPAIRKRLGMASAADWEVFGMLRELKNKG